MGQFTEAAVTTKTGITSAKFNAVIAALKTAFNSLTSDNFSAATAIPNAALANGKSYFALNIAYSPQIPQSNTAVQFGSVCVPAAATLVSVKFSAKDPGTGNEVVDLYLEDGSPATILSAPVTLAAANTVYSGTPATTSFSAGDLISLRATTGVGETIDQVTATLLFKVAHVS